MKIQMLLQIQGTLIGTHLNNPLGSARGDVIEVDDIIGARYIKNGLAVAVTGKPFPLAELPPPSRPGG